MNEIIENAERIARTFQERLTARTVYAEPISANGVTVVPVARVRFGFGAGGGGGTGTGPAHNPHTPFESGNGMAVGSGSGSGGGGGGGGSVEPLGFIEMSDIGARWVPVEPSRAEMFLRGLLAIAVIGPGGRGGFFRRVALMLAGQALIGLISRPRLSGGLSFGRNGEAS